MNLILPGLGANASMYTDSWRNLPNTTFIDWPIDYIPNSIPDLAQYLATQINEPADHIIGSSLGGMVALELAPLVNAKCVILIGSAISGQEVNNLQRYLSPLANKPTLKLARYLAAMIKHPLAQMYAEQNPYFVQTMLRAIPSWRYKGDISIFRIHGRRDLIINKPKDVDLWLDGGHAIGMTHADECVEAIQRIHSLD